jgi:hypothetical protein
MPLTGDSQVNKKAFRIAINSRKLARFYPLDREKTEKNMSAAAAAFVESSHSGPFKCRRNQGNPWRWQVSMQPRSR